MTLIPSAVSCGRTTSAKRKHGDRQGFVDVNNQTYLPPKKGLEKWKAKMDAKPEVTEKHSTSK